MKMYSDKEIKEMNKYKLEKALTNLQKEYEDLEDTYNNLDDSYGELERDNWDLQDEIDSLQAQVEYNETLVDMDYLKEKLELYGLKTEKLFDFLDLYMRLYNK